MLRNALLIALLLPSIALVLPSSLLAQEGPERPLADHPVPEEEKPPADQPLTDQPAGAGDVPLPGDWKIYVPFKDLKDVFEKEGQGVFVPFHEFMKLWEANLDKRPVPAEPPVPWIITRARYKGEVTGELATFTGTIEFETFRPGWSEVLLRMGGLALGEALLDGEPATLETVKGGYRVLVPRRGSYSLAVTFVTPVVKKEDARTVAFGIPPVPVSRLEFAVPGEKARVHVKPNLAMTRDESDKDVTRVMAYVGAASSIEITWLPRPAEIEVGPALVFADHVLTAVVEEAVLRVKSNVSYRIHRAPVETFRLRVPAEARVLFVEGGDLKSWNVEGDVLTVNLFKPVEKAYGLVVTLETDLLEAGPVRVPEVVALDVAREQGFVQVAAPPDVKVVPSATDLYRTDFAQVPKALRHADLILAYRFPAHPFSLSLDVTRIEPVLDVVGRSVIRLDERRLNQSDTFTFEVSRAGIFQARMVLPQGLELLDVSRDVVDDWRVTEGDRRVLELDLKERKIGSFVVTITTTRAVGLEEEALDLPLPLIEPLGVRRFTGTLGIVRDESLKLETKDVAGLVPMEASSFGGGAALAYSWREAGRNAVVTISRRDPEVSVVVGTALRAEENRLSVKSRLAFTVKYAGVEEFAFTVPADIAGRMEVQGNNIREKPVEEIEGEDGRVRQRVVLQGKVMGEYVLTVEYNLPFEGLVSGKEREVEIPALIVEGVEREQGAYAIYREPVLQITEEVEGLEPIDARELPAGVERKGVFRAFKYLSHPHGLSLTVSKHDLLGVLMAVVHHMHVITLLNEEGASRTEVLMEMTNNGLQFLSLKLPDGVVPDILQIKAPGARWRKASPQQGADGDILVRMPPEAGPDKRFQLRVVYPSREDLPGTIFHDFSFSAPVVQAGQVPVVGTTWYLYPPTDVKITQTGGTLSLMGRSDSWWGSVVRSFPEVFPRNQRYDRARLSVDPVTQASEIAPRDQDPLVFGGRSLEPKVEVAFADPATFLFLKVLALLGTVAIGVFGLRCGCRTSRVGYTLICIAVPLLLIPLAAVGTAELLTAVLVGGLAVGIFWCAFAVGPGLAAWGRSLRQSPGEPLVVEPAALKVQEDASEADEDAADDVSKEAEDGADEAKEGKGDGEEG